MPNCPVGLTFSQTHSRKRFEKAYETFGVNTINRIVGFVFFLLGAKREDIAKHLQIPLGTFLSFLTRTDQCGLLAFEDRRKKPFINGPDLKTESKVAVWIDQENLIIQLAETGKSIVIPLRNKLQCKVVLLTFANNGLLSTKEVADSMEISMRHANDLKTKMHEQDIYCLVDKRRGQIHDHRFTPEIKAELIQQVAANAVTGKPTSSRVISEQINERCNLHLPDRSVRFHMKKLGLPQISKSLPELVETLKKNSKQ